MQQSTNLNLTLLALNQSKKEVIVNEALITIDAIMNNFLIDIDVNNPPINPKNGDLYAIGEEPGDIWKKQKKNLAFWYVNSWRYIKPKTGLILWVKSKNKLCLYKESIWIEIV